MLIPCNAQNTYLIYSVCRLLLKTNYSNVLNTLFINKAVVNLATRALVTYIYIHIYSDLHSESSLINNLPVCLYIFGNIAAVIFPSSHFLSYFWIGVHLLDVHAKLNIFI